jgi:hypothetical protein
MVIGFLWPRRASGRTEFIPFYQGRRQGRRLRGRQNLFVRHWALALRRAAL